MSEKPLNILCISTFFKGQDFLRSCKKEGNVVYLLTKKKLESADWPWESIDEVLYINEWNTAHVINGIAYKFRSINFDSFVALDDFDVEKVASLREHFRMPGMGDTTCRHFRDKLAMRMKAHEAGIPVPAFTALFNNEDINSFADNIPAPWLIKPRHEASATGIKKIHSKDELWNIVNDLGDLRHQYLIEKFEPGHVYHVDSLTFENKLVFARASQYLDTPFEVAHSGGIFRSHTIEMGTEEETSLIDVNKDVIEAFGMKNGASHTEFIKSKSTGKIYFLETSSRVGGANLAEMVEEASGINLWGEWARIETATISKKKYILPKTHNSYAGIVVSLCRYEHPDTSQFTDKEIVWRMQKPWHIGFIVKSKSRKRVLELLDELTVRISKDFHASLPAKEKSSD